MGSLEVSLSGTLFSRMAFSQGVVTAQSEKLGQVTFTAAVGLYEDLDRRKRSRIQHDRFRHREFCIITLYGARTSSGVPKTDFAREWNTYVVENFGAAANADTETQVEDGWTVTAGGAPVEFQGSKAVAFLTVMTGYGKTVSVLGVFNNHVVFAAADRIRKRIEH